MKQKNGNKLAIGIIATLFIMATTAVVTGSNKKQNSNYDLYGQKLGTDSTIKLSVVDSSFVEDSMLLLWHKRKSDTALSLAKMSYIDSSKEVVGVFSKDTLINIRTVRKNK